MAVREKKAAIAEPTTTLRRLNVEATIPSHSTQHERTRRSALLHPRPGRYFLKPSLVARWGCTLST